MQLATVWISLLKLLPSCLSDIGKWSSIVRVSQHGPYDSKVKLPSLVRDYGLMF